MSILAEDLMMRTFIVTIFALNVALLMTPAFANDWSKMNVKERLAWTGSYIRQTCPHGFTGAQYGRKDEIANAPQWGVKVYVNFHCKL
jgi:hypothetical protein